DEEIDVVSLASQRAKLAAQNKATPFRRPRGRPPLNRKRALPQEPEDHQPAPKRRQTRKLDAPGTSSSTDEEAQQDEQVKNKGRKKGKQKNKEKNPDRRIQHNTMEKRRRVYMASLFQQLRSLIPHPNPNFKMPKVRILMEAANYCKNLHEGAKTLSKLREDVTKKTAIVKQLECKLQRR
ncbi:hypothetical protein EAI_10151, partial [Harpegnathos saltator]